MDILFCFCDIFFSHIYEWSALQNIITYTSRTVFRFSDSVNLKSQICSAAIILSVKSVPVTASYAESLAEMNPKPPYHWTYMQAYGAPRNMHIAWHKCKVWLCGPFDSCKGKPGCLCLILQHSLPLACLFVAMRCKPAHWNYQNLKKESNLLFISQFMFFPCARCVRMCEFFLPLKFE